MKQHCNPIKVILKCMLLLSENIWCLTGCVHCAHTHVYTHTRIYTHTDIYNDKNDDPRNNNNSNNIASNDNINESYKDSNITNNNKENIDNECMYAYVCVCMYTCFTYICLYIFPLQ